ncbi:MAG: hypothetical protein ACE5GK_08405 [Nitrospiria bacterium]
MRRLTILGVFAIFLGLTPTVEAAESEFNRISSTLYGPSGLFLTQSIDTLPPGKVEVGLGLSFLDGDNLKKEDLSVSELSSTLTVGITPNLEVSGQLPYFIDIEEGNESNSDVGDINFSLKWRLLEPSTNLNFPGFALSLTLFLPTGEPKTGAGTVDSWGLKALLVSSAETEVGTADNTVLIGFYANGGIFIQDSGDDNFEEKHGIIDLGLLIPLVESRALQLILEGNFRIDRESRLEREYGAATLGLRYVSRHLAVNGGWQHRVNEDPLDNSNRLIIYGSYFF